MPDTNRHVTSRGMSLIVRGQGDPVFLMHGIGGDARSCAPLANILSDQGYRTYCWDAPGYGRSVDVEPPFDHVEWALHTIEELEDQPVHVFGTSWGGVIGTLLAAVHPQVVRSLTLADSTRGSGVDPIRAQKMRARIDELREIGPAAFSAIRAPRLVAPSCPERVREDVRRTMSEIRLEGYAAAANMMASTDTAEVLAQLDVPTLVVVGAEDTVTGVDESRLLKRSIRNARLHIIEGAGHAALQEKPHEMADAMLEAWLSTTPGAVGHTTKSEPEGGYPAPDRRK